MIFAIGFDACEAFAAARDGQTAIQVVYPVKNMTWLVRRGSGIIRKIVRTNSLMVRAIEASSEGGNRLLRAYLLLMSRNYCEWNHSKR